MAAFLFIGLASFLFAQRNDIHAWAFDLTGEESTGAQVRGLWQLAGDAVRPPLDLRPDAKIPYADVNPYGINTFLEQEVEPEKRAEQVRLVAQAGFHWLRQEFPWYDIEIHARGDFEDRRFEPYRSAWDKYDNIVDLAEQNGLEIIARLSSPPDWSRANGAARGAFAPPDQVQDFANYAAAVAARYAGRVQHFQIWNEPNIFPEWGEQDVDPEAYTALLCAAYAAIKQVNPEAVVLSGALAPTAELAGRDLNDFIFLERMYAAGAGDCFDIMSVQGYGLWSGPTDHRMRPVVINYARNQFIRDMMVRHGDADKAIWISEMNWNAVPPASGLPPVYGRVTLEQQARWAPLAYARAQEDWPWIGVVNFWFFKRASDAEQNQSWYYFRMAEPDFTLLPVYDSMKAHIASETPAVYPGTHAPDHWALRYSGDWQIDSALATTDGGATLAFDWRGTDLSLQLRPAAAIRLRVEIDGHPPRVVESEAREIVLARGLPAGPHVAKVTAETPLALESIRVQERSKLLGPMLAALAVVLVAAWWKSRT